MANKQDKLFYLIGNTRTAMTSVVHCLLSVESGDQELGAEGKMFGCSSWVSGCRDLILWKFKQMTNFPHLSGPTEQKSLQIWGTKFSHLLFICYSQFIFNLIYLNCNWECATSEYWQLASPANIVHELQ